MSDISFQVVVRRADRELIGAERAGKTTFCRKHDHRIFTSRRRRPVGLSEPTSPDNAVRDATGGLDSTFQKTKC